MKHAFTFALLDSVVRTTPYSMFALVKVDDPPDTVIETTTVPPIKTLILMLFPFTVKYLWRQC